jgi:outer membrane protein OmpA-like peptidoglycan-associated protein
MECKIRVAAVVILLFTLTGCTYNPFSTNNELTGDPWSTAVGAGVGAGTAAVFQASKPVIVAAGLGGAALGYYVSTLRFASGGVIQNCGQVFKQGDYVMIEIPSDRLFDTNSADFLDDADAILNSAAAVLKRYPENHILISGNTSGFGSARFERRLSEDRARQVATYLWSQGINNFQGISNTMRKLTYVGYGNYFPIANNIRNNSIRQNSRIQITAYPTSVQLGLTNCRRIFNNVGSLGEPPLRCDSQ